jgi:hypothetical protein
MEAIAGVSWFVRQSLGSPVSVRPLPIIVVARVRVGMRALRDDGEAVVVRPHDLAQHGTTTVMVCQALSPLAKSD